MKDWEVVVRESRFLRRQGKRINQTSGRSASLIRGCDSGELLYLFLPHSILHAGERSFVGRTLSGCFVQLSQKGGGIRQAN